jgi:DNA adenine methylase
MGSSHNYNTPLRYPGGKGRISGFIEDIIFLNNLEGCTFYELYAGGAGASVNLLLNGFCENIVLNDLDYHIYAFWYSILYHTDQFVKLVNDTKIDVQNWRQQKEIYDNCKNHEIIEVGFSTFFLNRANRSGILYKAGPIGGFDQTGNYKIDVRFNKLDLISRIERVASMESQIKIHNKESKLFLVSVFKKKSEKKIIFLDPPYYIQGENLYMSFYNDNDHAELCKTLTKHRDENWLLTYDNCDRINSLYSNFRRTHVPMSYTLQSKRTSKEIAIFSDSLYLPKSIRVGNKSLSFNLIDSTQ